MSDKLDAIAYRERSEYRLRRLEEMVLLLHTVVAKSFNSKELLEIYDKHIEEIRREINSVNNTISNV